MDTVDKFIASQWKAFTLAGIMLVTGLLGAALAIGLGLIFGWTPALMVIAVVLGINGLLLYKLVRIEGVMLSMFWKMIKHVAKSFFGGESSHQDMPFEEVMKTPFDDPFFTEPLGDIGFGSMFGGDTATRQSHQDFRHGDDLLDIQPIGLDKVDPLTLMRNKSTAHRNLDEVQTDDSLLRHIPEGPIPNITHQGDQPTGKYLPGSSSNEWEIHPDGSVEEV